MGGAREVGNGTWLMNEGRMGQRGSGEDLRDRPANEFVSEFINAQRGAAF